MRRRGKDEPFDWKRFIVVIIAIVVILLLGFYAAIHIDILTNDQIHIDLEPRIETYAVQNDERIVFKKSLEVDNFWLCDSFCNITTYDTATNKVLSFEESEAAHLEHVINVKMQSPKPGKRYIITETSCYNKPTFLCPSNAEVLHDSAMTVLEHRYSDTQETMKSEVETKFAEFSYRIAEYESQVYRIANLTKDLPVRYNANLTLLIKELDQARYTESLMMELYDEAAFQEALNLKLQVLNVTYVQERRNRVEELIRIYNINAELFNVLNQSLNDVDQLFSFLQKSQDYSGAYELYKSVRLLSSLQVLHRDGLKNAYAVSVPLSDTFTELLPLLNASRIARNVTISRYIELAGPDFCSSNITSIQKYCSTEEDILPGVPDIGSQNISLPTEEIHLNVRGLKLIRDECCFEDKCNSCESARYPIIFIHGHSFTDRSGVSAIQGTFSMIQQRLSHDGIVLDGNTYEPELGLDEQLGAAPFPFSVRHSYYLFSYYDLGLASATIRKNDNIENYAIRLHESIRDIRAKSGADKVTIIAHSMGGLVARKYMNIFDDTHIDKVIMIGTPNGGIIGRISDYCNNFGADPECEDMQKDSIFLKKLSTYIPVNAQIYTIYGTGCPTAGFDGDGVTTADNVKLTYATNIQINGSCTDSLGINLHSKMLDPSIYPDVYEEIKKILIQ
ncbi:alpha/beta fold hydrolase [Candidatus Woesearchaeota archaeon]|nr:alpha/beta fold hydrolase [Candidatus Woesearchaeota archaeon]